MGTPRGRRPLSGDATERPAALAALREPLRDGQVPFRHTDHLEIHLHGRIGSDQR
jgi:hypothetical protein